MNQKKDYKLFCLYHNKVFSEYYGNQIDQVTFVKMDKSSYVFNSKNHIYLAKQKWFESIGKEWAEYEFYYSLYQGYKKGLIELPEYMGFIHYDMEFISKNRLNREQTIIEFIEEKFIEKLINCNTVIFFQPYSFGVKLNVPPKYPVMQLRDISFFKKWITHSKLRKNLFKTFNTFEDLLGKEIGMSGAYFLHRNIFMKIMENFSDLVHDKLLQKMDKQKRTQGLIAELYLAFSLLDLYGLKFINFKITHHCLTFKEHKTFENIVRFMGRVGYKIKNKNVRFYKILKPLFPDIKIK